jgi:hypothetical protein
MIKISKTDALTLLSKWERENESVSILCFSPSFVLSSKMVRIAMCLDECIELVFANEAKLRIFISGATFSRVAGNDLPEGGQLPVQGLEQGIHIGVPSGEMRWYLFVTVGPVPILRTV